MTVGEDGEKEKFLAKAESFLALEKFNLAQELALDWLRRFPSDAEARIIVCHAWTRLGKLDKVRQMLQEVDEAILSLSRIYARMGDICRQSGLNQEAITFYQRFAVINPQVHDITEITDKLRALEPSPDTDMLQDEGPVEQRRPLPGLQTVTLAELYIKQGHPDAAMEMLEGILKRDKTNLRASAMLREIRKSSGVSLEENHILTDTERVKGELNRWLCNIDRIRHHAA